MNDRDPDTINETQQEAHGFESADMDAAVGAFLQAATAASTEPINWRTLSPEDAEDEWLELNAWVDWLRREFALPPSIVPPAWHRHPELVWELSALRQRWIGCYDPAQSSSGPLAFMTDFAAARARLRDWVAQSGTRLDTDRPSRQTQWPGEPEPDPASEVPIADRTQDFIAFVRADVRRREATQTEALRSLSE